MNLRTFFFVVLGIYTSSSLAQERLCDIETIIFKPEPFDTFVSPGEYTVAIGIVNLGPDTLNKTDQYFVKYKLGGVHKNATYHDIDRLVYPFDTFYHEELFISEYRVSVDSLLFCAEAYVWNTAIDPMRVESEDESKNNKACVRAFHIDNYPVSTRLLEANQSTVYPNPILRGEWVNIGNLEPKSEVYVFDAEGKRLYHSNNTEDKLEINTSSWSSGIYFLRIRNDFETSITKIVVQ
jgi:hypothetical protein